MIEKVSQGGCNVKMGSLTPKAWGLTPKARGLTPKAWGLTPKAWGLTPKAWGLTPDCRQLLNLGVAHRKVGASSCFLKFPTRGLTLRSDLFVRPGFAAPWPTPISSPRYGFERSSNSHNLPHEEVKVISGTAMIGNAHT
jgi:hypothetical protein